MEFAVSNNCVLWAFKMRHTVLVNTVRAQSLCTKPEKKYSFVLRFMNYRVFVSSRAFFLKRIFSLVPATCAISLHCRCRCEWRSFFNARPRTSTISRLSAASCTHLSKRIALDCHNMMWNWASTWKTMAAVLRWRFVARLRWCPAVSAWANFDDRTSTAKWILSISNYRVR